MEFELRNDKHGADELRECAKENVRYYYTPKVSMLGEELYDAEAASRWTVASETDSVAWSAVGWYFAKELSRRLGCTVGILGCNWGGTSASAWVPRDVLDTAMLRPYLDEYDSAVEGKSDRQMIAEYDEYTAYQTGFDRRVGECYAENPDIAWKDVLEKCGENRYPGPLGIKNPMRPCGLFDTMVSRVSPYELMCALIRCWRGVWHDDSMAFLIVQLPMYSCDDDDEFTRWAFIREAQERLFRTVKNTGLAVTLDCGEYNNIHPTDKSAVGYRLFLQAMSEVYGLMDRADTMLPMFGSHEVRHGDTMVVNLDNPSHGLSGNDRCREGFELAGADGVYFPADSVEIFGNQIHIKSEKVKRPVNVRFKWINYADVGLFGSNGIPAAPFRTDAFRKEDR